MGCGHLGASWSLLCVQHKDRRSVRSALPCSHSASSSQWRVQRERGHFLGYCHADGSPWALLHRQSSRFFKAFT